MCCAHERNALSLPSDTEKIRLNIMAKYHDSGYDFLMSKVTIDETGKKTIANEVNIEEQFPGLVYKQCTGLDSFGKPRPYVENYAESDEAYVYVPSNDARDQISITLTLYFFDPSNSKDDATAITSAEKVYQDFMKYISGGLILFRDTARKRKVLIYQSDAPSVKTDKLYGVIYKEVEIKFTSVYGRSFGYDEILP